MWFSSSASPSPLEGLSLIGSPSSPAACPSGVRPGLRLLRGFHGVDGGPKNEDFTPIRSA
ncbi:hypothetical protein QJS10_CPB04g01777 [Acorus calamus]|uniref:Uncharacterized protein n=1 Tax=Acorus calamus TaxID=4465 RepID=A0AAV9F2M3_ACOCL|nr:hypothetical protein QJS10_CPB04g01777 [Acorus calamus]